MTRLILCWAALLLLVGCGDRAFSSAQWADVREQIQPDQSSGAICDIFGSIPVYDGRDGFTWYCADGRFAGVFTPNQAGDPILLYGRFIPSRAPQGQPQTERPSESDMLLMRQLQQHWHTPLPDLDGALRRLEELGQASTDPSDRQHSQRLTDTARAAAAWVAAGRPEPLPFTFTMAEPGDMDIAWMVLAITGDERCLRHIVVAATSAKRSVQFAARWSLDANIRQDSSVYALTAAMTWAPAERQLVDRIRSRSTPQRITEPTPQP
jgi:hypothetical protein